MKDLHHSCQGESHILSNKVCQDSSYSSTSDTMSIAIVCDGHGGARYFRSDVGSRFAVDATTECVQAFVSEIDVNLFKDKPITQHSQNTPLSEEERSSIKLDYLSEFEQGIGIEKTYGCTLMCYVYTDLFWFAFHIGDGKCVAFDNNGTWFEPIPWDEKCFLNKTTSLCDSSAIEEFRYCYCGDGNKPLAVFLGSDGIDDSFGATENMVNFYVQVLKLINKEGLEIAVTNIQETLPQLSKIGSKDDMSIACIYDEEALRKKEKYLVGWQRRNIENQLFEVNNRILKYKDEIARLSKCDLRNQKLMIDFQYAKKDLSKAFELKHSLANKWNKFSEEIDGETYTPYKDEIGWEESYIAEPDATDTNCPSISLSNEAETKVGDTSADTTKNECHENSEEDTEIDSKVDETVGIKEESMTDIKEKDNNNIAEEE